MLVKSPVVKSRDTQCLTKFHLVVGYDPHESRVVGRRFVVTIATVCRLPTTQFRCVEVCSIVSPSRARKPRRSDKRQPYRRTHSLDHSLPQYVGEVQVSGIITLITCKYYLRQVAVLLQVTLIIDLTMDTIVTVLLQVTLVITTKLLRLMKKFENAKMKAGDDMRVNYTAFYLNLQDLQQQIKSCDMMRSR
jgi:hypothetical protein